MKEIEKKELSRSNSSRNNIEKQRKKGANMKAKIAQKEVKCLHSKEGGVVRKKMKRRKKQEKEYVDPKKT